MQKRLQPLFYAMLRGVPLEQQRKEREKQPKKSPQGPQQAQIETKPSAPTPDQDTADTSPPSPSLSMQQIPIDDYIPATHEAIRETPLFSQFYRLIQFQRDQYLVGEDYAKWQQKERQSSVLADPSDRLPLDPTALGHIQIARVAADFIPTATVRQAALPLVTPLPTDTLYPLLRDATIRQGILGQQALLNRVTIDAVLNFIKNPQNRLAIKRSTYGFIETKYND